MVNKIYQRITTQQLNIIFMEEKILWPKVEEFFIPQTKKVEEFFRKTTPKNWNTYGKQKYF